MPAGVRSDFSNLDAPGSPEKPTADILQSDATHSAPPSPSSVDDSPPRSNELGTAEFGGAGEDFRDAARARANQARAAAEQQVTDARDQTIRKGEELARSAVERARVETDTFTFGIFPNSAGFMDARMHARLQYATLLSSGLYLDYTTARAVSEVANESRAERLVREYRAETDLLKGIIVLTRSGDFAWSLEPGLNGKLIFQDIQDSGFNTNSFDETVFRSSNLKVAQWVSSLKLDTTLVLGTHLTLDVSGEYLPLIYQSEKGSSVTSQFEDPVDFSIANRVNGYQGSVDLEVDTNTAGRFTLSGRAYRNEGKVSSQSALVSGNFEYIFETFDSASRQDYWVEFIHTADYVRLFGNLAPALALAVQRKRIITANDELQADTYKVGFLLEWL